MPVDERITEEIKRLMKRERMSRYRLAIITGMSRARLTNFLNGKTTDIRLSTIERIAEALNCDVDVILRPRK